MPTLAAPLELFKWEFFRNIKLYLVSYIKFPVRDRDMPWTEPAAKLYITYNKNVRIHALLV